MDVDSDFKEGEDSEEEGSIAGEDKNRFQDEPHLELARCQVPQKKELHIYITNNELGQESLLQTGVIRLAGEKTATTTTILMQRQIPPSKNSAGKWAFSIVSILLYNVFQSDFQHYQLHSGL